VSESEQGSKWDYPNEPCLDSRHPPLCFAYRSRASSVALDTGEEGFVCDLLGSTARGSNGRSRGGVGVMGIRTGLETGSPARALLGFLLLSNSLLLCSSESRVLGDIRHQGGERDSSVICWEAHLALLMGGAEEGSDAWKSERGSKWDHSDGPCLDSQKFIFSLCSAYRSCAYSVVSDTGGEGGIRL
jgi:hypothetical protein